MEYQPLTEPNVQVPVEQLGPPEAGLDPAMAGTDPAQEAAAPNKGFELSADPTPAELLAYAQRNLALRGLPVSGAAGRVANRYSAVDITFTSVHGEAGGDGMDHVSTHGTPSEKLRDKL